MTLICFSPSFERSFDQQGDIFPHEGTKLNFSRDTIKNFIDERAPTLGRIFALLQGAAYLIVRHGALLRL